MREEISKMIDEKRQGEVLASDAFSGNENSRKMFIESYGCAMNFSDSEIVAAILSDAGFTLTSDYKTADIILVNTCSVRENAELRVRARLFDYKKVRKSNPELIVGVLGCMAERLKYNLLEEEKLVDLVVGPDSYRDLPKLIETVDCGQKAVNVLLSRDETYADINPVRLGGNGISAFISITRGCNNMCSYCVVPFTRGRERSRNPESIVAEARNLFENGYKEVTLLGQNVDSYLWKEVGLKTEALVNSEHENGANFAQLLELVAQISPDLRVRFSTSHPRDMKDDVLYTIAKYDNICNYVHLPVQSGSTRILGMMNRGYTRDWYIDRIKSIRQIVPECGISTDTISGFCSETKEDHKDTLSLMDWAGFDFSYMFKYSVRPNTFAEREFKDDVPEDIKSRRLQEIIDLQSKLSHRSNLSDLNKVHRVLAESVSKRSKDKLKGRNSQNKVVIFPKKNFKPGDYVDVLVTECTAATLFGEGI